MDARQAKAMARANKAFAKASRPFYKKKRVLFPIVVIVVIIIIMVTKSSADKKAEDKAAATCAGVSYPDQQKLDICADAAHTVVLDGVSVTAAPFVSKTDALDGKALCSDVTLKNNSSKSKDYNIFDWKVQTPSGDVSTTSVLNMASTLSSGTIIAGASKNGLVCTDDKGEKGTYVLIYKPSGWNDDRGVWLNAR